MFGLEIFIFRRQIYAFNAGAEIIPFIAKTKTGIINFADTRLGRKIKNELIIEELHYLCQKLQN